MKSTGSSGCPPGHYPDYSHTTSDTGGLENAGFVKNKRTFSVHSNMIHKRVV